MKGRVLMGFLRRVIVYGLAAGLSGFVAGRMHRDIAAAVDEVEGGRFARSPFDMTSVGWRDIFTRSLYAAVKDRILTISASVAFYILLSLVPALTVLITIYGMFVVPSSIPDQIAALTNIFPDAARSLIQEQAIRLVTQPNSTHSIMLVVSLAIAAWSANAAIKALFEAMNVMWGTTDTRSFFRLTLESFLFTFAGIIIVILVLVAMTDIPAYISVLAIDPTLKWLLIFLRWPIVYCAGLLAIVMLYRRGPCRPAPKVIWTLPGAIMASLVWIAASVGFSWYVSSLAHYTATYGSLAAVIVTMTWLWLSAVILLAGAELSAQIEWQIDHGSERLTGLLAIMQAAEHHARKRTAN